MPNFYRDSMNVVEALNLPSQNSLGSADRTTINAPVFQGTFKSNLLLDSAQMRKIDVLSRNDVRSVERLKGGRS